MKFKIDENLPEEIADQLNRAGHDATSVWSERLTGVADGRIAEKCREEGRILVTLDVDFADLRTYPPAEYPGFMVLRVKREDKPHVMGVMESILPKLTREPLEHRLWIVEETRVRIRGE